MKKEKQDFYEFHGLVMESQIDKERQYTCPFCDKEGHFYTNTETGQYDCKSCGEKGNRYTFLKKLIEESNKEQQDYQDLIKDRPITEPILKRCEVCRSFLTKRWLLPCYNADKKLANIYVLYRFKVKGEWKQQWRGSPTMSAQLFGASRFKKRIKSVHIFEGVWDYLAALSYFGQYRESNGKLVKVGRPTKAMLKDMNVLGLPGATTFKDDWSDMIGDREVFTVLDDDEAGKKGTERIAKSHPVQAVDWSSHSGGEFPTKFDFSDAVTKYGRNTWPTLSNSLQRIDLKEEKDDDGHPLVQPIPCDNFRDVARAFQNALYFTTDTRTALIAALAVAASTPAKGEQVWLRIFGPPGCGKTVIAEALSMARNHVTARSDVTGFHSGMNQTGLTLIEKINGQTFIVKEADALLSNRSQATILSELRDIYDGVSRKEYRNGRSSIHEGLRITFILCGTDYLKSMNRSHLGDRFLDVDLFRTGSDPSKYVDSAADNMLATLTNGKHSPQHDLFDSDKVEYASQLAAGFLIWCRESEEFQNFSPEMSPEVVEKLKKLAGLLSLLRARPANENDETPNRAELPTRLTHQLIKFCFFCGKVLGTEKITPRSQPYKIARRIMEDTAQGYIFSVFKHLVDKNQPQSVRAISRELPIMSPSKLHTCLHVLRHFKLVEQSWARNSVPKKGGRNQGLWKVTEEKRQLWRDTR